jgi:O-antigen/teichoic acid export membrane protein
MQKLSAMIARAKQSHFLRAVAVLGTGTVLAQIITIAAAPILTRLYSPADFGLAALFAAIIASITPAICGKYEVAIVVAKTVAVSRQLLGVALNVTLAVSLLALAAVLLFDSRIIALFNAERLGDWLLLVPPMLVLTGVLAGLKYYSNRMHEYQVISQAKVLMAIIAVVSSIILGIAGVEAGLLLSTVLATGVAVGWLSFRHRSISYRRILAWSRRNKLLAKRYRDFPLFSASSGLLDGLTLAMPVFFLSSYFSESLVGFYALMLRVAAAPLSFVAGAVSQVNLKKVADLVHQGQSVRPYFWKVTLLLATVVTPVAVVLIMFAPSLFAWVFGEQWRAGGSYLQILMPALALRFIASTVSTTFGATGNNRLGAVWKVSAFGVTFVVLFLAAPRVDAEGMFVTFLLTDLFLYSFYYLLAWRAAGHPRALTNRRV